MNEDKTLKSLKEQERTVRGDFNDWRPHTEQRLADVPNIAPGLFKRVTVLFETDDNRPPVTVVLAEDENYHLVVPFEMKAGTEIRDDQHRGTGEYDLILAVHKRKRVSEQQDVRTETGEETSTPR